MRLMKILTLSIWVLITAAVTGPAKSDETTRELDWSDLIPPMLAFEDPFLALTPDQLSDLSLVAGYRAQQAHSGQLSEQSEVELRRLTDALTAQGIDIDGLLAQRNEIKLKRKAAAEAVDTSLDQRKVRIPGFLLPLEFNGTRVTEFLLVPTVGACIHVPPPPPNQMVHVAFAEGFDNEKLYAPVWVEGTMTVGRGQSNLYLADGSAEISFGYRLDATKVVDYQE